MSRPFDPQGAWTAVVTPFNPRGQLDLSAFRQLLRFQMVCCEECKRRNFIDQEDEDALHTEPTCV